MGKRIQRELDDRIKAGGAAKRLLPLLSESYLRREGRGNVEGFSPEPAVVTIGEARKTRRSLCHRPTSETVIGERWPDGSRATANCRSLLNQGAKKWCAGMRYRLFCVQRV